MREHSGYMNKYDSSIYRNAGKPVKIKDTYTNTAYHANIVAEYDNTMVVRIPTYGDLRVQVYISTDKYGYHEIVSQMPY